MISSDKRDIGESVDYAFTDKLGNFGFNRYQSNHTVEILDNIEIIETITNRLSDESTLLSAIFVSSTSAHHSVNRRCGCVKDSSREMANSDRPRSGSIKRPLIFITER